MDFSLLKTRRANHIISFLHPESTEAEEVDDEIMHTLANIHRIFPDWTICTCRFMHTNFFYVSDNFHNILGMDPTSEPDSTVLDKFFLRVHPTDHEEFQKGIHVITELLEKTPTEEHHLYRFVFNYRVMRADGVYVHIHDEKAMLVLKSEKRLYYMLLRDINSETPFSGFKITVYKEGLSGKVLEYRPAAHTAALLTPRENELIPLMRQGLSIKETAGCLGISPNTVRNMRQKLFEKFQVNNVIELLNRIEAATSSFNQNDLAAAV